MYSLLNSNQAGVNSRLIQSELPGSFWLSGVTDEKKCVTRKNSNLPQTEEHQTSKEAGKLQSKSLAQKRSIAPAKVIKRMKADSESKPDQQQRSATSLVDRLLAGGESSNGDGGGIISQPKLKNGLGERRKGRSLVKKKDKIQYSGKAAKHLLNNPLRSHLESIATDKDLTARNGTARQLQHAILGTGVQCNSCLKFIGGSVKWQSQHKYDCKGYLNYRINFLTIDAEYFCYYGCDQRFASRTDLMSHLLEKHRPTLPDWGISAELLTHSLNGNTRYKAGFSAASSRRVCQPNLEIGLGEGQIGAQNSFVRDSQPKDQPWLVRELLSRTIIGSDSQRLTAASNPGRTIRIASCLHRVFSIEHLSKNLQTVYLLINHKEQEHTLSTKFPKLGLLTSSLQRHADKTISISYQIDARTPIMLYRDKRWPEIKTCFLKALDLLVLLHKGLKIFHGGIRRNTVALTQQNEVIFLDWSHSVELNKPRFVMVPKTREYPSPRALKRDEDYFIADLCALAIAYVESLRLGRLSKRLQKSLMFKRSRKFAKKSATPKEFLARVTAHLQFSENAPYGDGPASDSGEDDYDELVGMLKAYFGRDVDHTTV